jgi:hypothetical protein
VPLAVLMGRPAYLVTPPGLIEHLRKRGVPCWLVGINDEEALAGAIGEVFYCVIKGLAVYFFWMFRRARCGRNINPGSRAYPSLQLVLIR